MIFSKKTGLDKTVKSAYHQGIRAVFIASRHYNPLEYGGSKTKGINQFASKRHYNPLEYGGSKTLLRIYMPFGEDYDLLEYEAFKTSLLTVKHLYRTIALWNTGVLKLVVNHPLRLECTTTL